jgi:hypothetical protein
MFTARCTIYISKQHSILQQFVGRCGQVVGVHPISCVSQTTRGTGAIRRVQIAPGASLLNVWEPNGTVLGDTCHPQRSSPYEKLGKESEFRRSAHGAPSFLVFSFFFQTPRRVAYL